MATFREFFSDRDYEFLSCNVQSWRIYRQIVANLETKKPAVILLVLVMGVNFGLHFILGRICHACD